MNIRNSALCLAVALVATVSSVFADVTINITGSTAFRAAAHTSIIATLGGAGTAQYAYSKTDGTAATSLSGADRSIFVGPVSGLGTVTVRCSWTGSAAGITSVVTGSTVSVPVMATSVSTSGVNGGISFETAVAKFAFSDIAQAASNNPTPAISGTQVGVVPFMFVAQEGAPSGMTNITDQLVAALYGSGSSPLSMFTGSAADESILVVPTGRASTSGTRIAVLAETGYGFNTTVSQFQPTISGGFVTALGTPGNGGYSSGSSIVTVLGTPMSVALASQYLVVGWIGISDANAAIAAGAKGLTYNGVAYSEDNVKNGQYSLWSYQWFYNADGLSSNETTFRDTFVATIPTNIGTAGIPIPDMKVSRAGGDGGQISTNL